MLRVTFFDNGYEGETYMKFIELSGLRQKGQVLLAQGDSCEGECEERVL